MADIFRKKSLDKLSSPEQLDKMIVISSPITKLALAGGAFILVIGLLWGIFGNVPITEEGNGLLLREEEVTLVHAETEGVITKAFVTSGDSVEKGDVLFEVKSEKTVDQIEDLQERIDKVEAVTFTSENDSVTSDNEALTEIKNQKTSLSLNSDAYSEKLDELNERYDDKKKEVETLKQKKNQAEEKYNDNPMDAKLQAKAQQALTDYNTAKAELKSLKTEIGDTKLQLSAEEDSEKTQRKALRKQFEAKKESILDQLNRELKTYKTLKEGMEITAPTDGTIYTTSVTKGSSVTMDMQVASIGEPDMGWNMQAVYFMPLDSGKKVEKGMKVNIYPNPYAKEEYGHMTGTVVKVADYVTSYAELYARVEDSTLADSFIKNGAVVEVVCEIEADDSTASGFAWSSKKGEGVEVKEGTLLTGNVVIEEVAPITMLIPKLKERFDMELEQKNAEEAMLEAAGTTTE